MNRKHRIGVVASVIGLALCCFTHAQSYRRLGTVMDGSGGRSTNTVLLGGQAFTNVSASGQPGGIAVSGNAAAGLTNYAGFLQAVDIKRPNQKDIYGNPYELTPDNDADGLTDLTEVTGSAFDPETSTSPNNPDSDGDSASDRDESVAGTNPSDSNRLFEVVGIQPVGTDKAVRWSARSGKSYRLLSAEQASFVQPTNVVETVNVVDPGASAPWYETTASYTNTGSADGRYYSVEVIP